VLTYVVLFQKISNVPQGSPMKIPRGGRGGQKPKVLKKSMKGKL